MYVVVVLPNASVSVDALDAAAIAGGLNLPSTTVQRTTPVIINFPIVNTQPQSDSQLTIPVLVIALTVILLLWLLREFRQRKGISKQGQRSVRSSRLERRRQVLCWADGKEVELSCSKMGHCPAGGPRASEIACERGTFRYHVFLSHTWSTGQDQMRIVKERLQGILPRVRVFLDVRRAG
jgi:hypothetical protein